MKKPAKPSAQGSLFDWNLVAPEQPPNRPAAPPRPVLELPDDLLAISADAFQALLERALDRGVTASQRRRLLDAAVQRPSLAAIPTLLRILRLFSAVDADKPAREVKAVLAALQALGDRASAAELATILQAGRYAPASWAAGLALFQAVRFNPPVELLVRAFEFGVPEVTILAARLAGRGQRRRLSGLLRGLLTDPNPGIRLAAAIGLGLLGDRSVKPALERAFTVIEAPFDGLLLDSLSEIGDAETLVLLRKRCLLGCAEADLILVLGLAVAIGGGAARNLLAEIAATATAPGLLAAIAELRQDLADGDGVA